MVNWSKLGVVRTSFWQVTTGKSIQFSGLRIRSTSGIHIVPLSALHVAFLGQTAFWHSDPGKHKKDVQFMGSKHPPQQTMECVGGSGSGNAPPQHLWCVLTLRLCPSVDPTWIQFDSHSVTIPGPIQLTRLRFALPTDQDTPSESVSCVYENRNNQNKISQTRKRKYILRWQVLTFGWSFGLDQTLHSYENELTWPPWQWAIESWCPDDSQPWSPNTVEKSAEVATLGRVHPS